LLYIDPGPGPDRRGVAAPAQPGRLTADILIDDPPVRFEIENRLARLEQKARDRGAALGLIGQPLPVTLDRLAAWAATVGSRGIALVPVSALVAPLPGRPEAPAAPHRANKTGTR
jgi:polysaccharide deacetylase 2 family uncharacterized protein YibQ